MQRRTFYSGVGADRRDHSCLRSVRQRAGGRPGGEERSSLNGGPCHGRTSSFRDVALSQAMAAANKASVATPMMK